MLSVVNYRERPWFKIGSSTNVERRIVELTRKYGHAIGFEPIHVIGCEEEESRAAESVLHAHFVGRGRQRANRDYFELVDADVVAIRELASYADVLAFAARGLLGG